MSPKKKKRPEAAQNLIDSLLDEKTFPPAEPDTSGVFQLREEEPPTALAVETHQEPTRSDLSDDIVISAEDENMSQHFQLERSPDPVFSAEGEKRVSTQAQAQAPHRTPAQPDANLIDLATKTGPAPGSDDEATRVLAPASKPGSGAEPDKTIRLDDYRSEKSQSWSFSRSDETASATQFAQPGTALDRHALTDVKTTIGTRDRLNERPQRAGTSQPVSGGFASSEAALRQSESLRIAQARISELEAELERARRDSERLASAGETLGRRSDELASKLEQIELNARESERIFEEEKKVFRGQIQQKDRDLNELKARLEEMESRLENNFKKIRVRERELEHRLEIVRLESQTLVTTKDKMILDLKRQLDQLLHENEYGKQRSQELFNQFKDKQETIRRVVRALRIALTILEGDEDANGGKKTE